MIEHSNVKKVQQALKALVKKDNRFKHMLALVEIDARGTYITIPSGEFIRHLEEAKIGDNTNGLNQTENGDLVEEED